jgi:hypothetical protein
MRAKGYSKTAVDEIHRLISLSTNLKLNDKVEPHISSAKQIKLDNNVMYDVVVDPWEKSDLSWSDEMNEIKKDVLDCMQSGKKSKYNRMNIKRVLY